MGAEDSMSEFLKVTGALVAFPLVILMAFAPLWWSLLRRIREEKRARVMECYGDDEWWRAKTSNGHVFRAKKVDPPELVGLLNWFSEYEGWTVPRDSILWERLTDAARVAGWNDGVWIRKES